MNNDQVKNYFDKTSTEFDGIYDSNSLLDRVFHKGMYERVAETIRQCGDVKGKSVLDVGCGSGRIALALATRGASVVGVDYAPKMITLANTYKSKYRDVDAEFSCYDFLADYATDKMFDITIALGVTDYLADPIPLLEKMARMTKGMMIVSFPAKFCPQALLRKAWLWTRKCPVYFYDARRLEEMYWSFDVHGVAIVYLPSGARFPTDYLVICDVD